VVQFKKEWIAPITAIYYKLAGHLARGNWGPIIEVMDFIFGYRRFLNTDIAEH
jgi:hypothetical protein